MAQFRHRPDAFRRHRLLHTPLTMVLAAATALSGCAVGPDFVAPAAPAVATYIPDQSTALVTSGAGQGSQQMVVGASLQPDWWTLFGSSELSATVEMALANNRELAAAQANVARAVHGIAAAKGAWMPQVDGSASIRRQKVGASTLGPSAFTFPTFSAYSGGAEVSYDIDLFGGIGRRVEQAAAEAEAERQKLNAVRLVVAGGVVISALQIAATRAQMEAVEDIVRSDERTLTLVRDANASGMASGIDLALAQSQLDRDRALLPPLRQQLSAAENALAVLVGKAPAEWRAPEFELELLNLPVKVPLVIPSDLVRVRPDIRAAEASLHAANAAIGVATADLYPHINLSAGIAGEGLTSGGFESAWGLVGGIVGPIFDGGTLKARRKQAVAAYEASLAQYQQTVLQAFQQVADALYGLSNTAEAIRAQQNALASATEALELTRHGFANGSAGVIQILDAQRLHQLARIELIQARTQRYVQTVNLFVAMGGGVSDDDRPEVENESLTVLREP